MSAAMILAVTHNLVDLAFVGLGSLGISGWLLWYGLLVPWREQRVDPWAAAVAVERARIHGRKVRARRRRRAAAVRRSVRRR